MAAATGNAAAAAALYDALLPYQGRLVIWGGANTVTGPVCRYLGQLAHRLGRPAETLAHLDRGAGLGGGDRGACLASPGPWPPARTVLAARSGHGDRSGPRPTGAGPAPSPSASACGCCSIR